MLRTTVALVVLSVPFLAQVPVDDAPATTEELSQAELEALAAELADEVEALRGAEFTEPVDVALADAESFRTYVTLRMQRLMPAERLASEEEVYKLLGLLPPELSYMQTMMSMLESQVGGFYDPGEDRFYLMKSFTGGLAEIILAHELTHALDDQRWDLDAELIRRLDNSDALFAYQAVVEGSGVTVMNSWMFGNMTKLSIEEIQRVGNLGMEGLRDVPPALWKPLLAAYVRGAAFLVNSESANTGQMAKPIPAKIDAAFDQPPRSSEQILHPKKYWDEPDEPVALDVSPAGLPDGVRVLAQDTLGELGASLFVEPVARRHGLRSQADVLTARYTSRAGEGWGGDRLVLVGKGRARALVWWTVWDTPQDAAEFAEATDKVLEHVRSATARWSAMRGFEGESNVRFRPAPELDPERAHVLVSSGGFSASELDAILAGLAVQRRPAEPVAEEPAPEREAPLEDSPED
ncbi:MAG: hypothetical protein WD226_04345 [Planctomycetota bacterium]